MGTHPMTHLIESIFALHDSAAFEVRVYALNSNDGSQARARIAADAEALIDLSGERNARSSLICLLLTISKLQLLRLLHKSAHDCACSNVHVCGGRT